MAERLTPGVYVEEIPGGVRPIQGVGTSTAAFVGRAQRGIPDRATFVTGFGDFQRQFGGHSRGEAGFLAQAVDAFFAAGGRRAFVVRVLPANAGPPAFSSALPARADDAWGVRHDVLRLTAKGQGAWADHLRVHIEESTAFAGEAFRLRIEWVEAGRSRTLETFDGVRMDPESEDYVVRLVNETSQYVNAGRPLPDRLHRRGGAGHAAHPRSRTLPGRGARRRRRVRRARRSAAHLRVGRPVQLDSDPGQRDGRAQRGGDRGRGRDGRR